MPVQHTTDTEDDPVTKFLNHSQNDTQNHSQNALTVDGSSTASSGVMLGTSHASSASKEGPVTSDYFVHHDKSAPSVSPSSTAAPASATASPANYFLAYDRDQKYLDDRSSGLPSRQRQRWVIALILFAFAVFMMIIAFNVRDRTKSDAGQLGGLLTILGDLVYVVYLGAHEAKRIRLQQNGTVVSGHLTADAKELTYNSKNRSYYRMNLLYTFTVPETGEQFNKATKIPMRKDDDLPSSGTPIYVVYVDRNTFMLL